MGATDRRPELREQLAKVLAKRTFGEQHGFDVGPAILPGPKGVMTGYVVVITTGSVTLAPRLAGAYFIGDAWPTVQMLEHAVIQCLAVIGRLREQAAQAGNGQRSESGLFHG